MINCVACHYQALGPIDLAGHIAAQHGFTYERAKREALVVASEQGYITDIQQEGVKLQADLARLTAERDAALSSAAQARAGEEAERARRDAVEAAAQAVVDGVALQMHHAPGALVLIEKGLIRRLRAVLERREG